MQRGSERMSRKRYYILTAAQVAIIDQLNNAYGLNIDYEIIDDNYCVEDFQAITDALDEVVWADGEISDQEGGWLDTFEEYVDYMYYSTETHTWSPVT